MSMDLQRDLIVPMKYLCYDGPGGTAGFLKELSDRELTLYTEFRLRQLDVYAPLINNEWNRRHLLRPASCPGSELLRASQESKSEPTELLRASDE